MALDASPILRDVDNMRFIRSIIVTETIPSIIYEVILPPEVPPEVIFIFRLWYCGILLEAMPSGGEGQERIPDPNKEMKQKLPRKALKKEADDEGAVSQMSTISSEAEKL